MLFSFTLFILKHSLSSTKKEIALKRICKAVKLLIHFSLISSKIIFLQSGYSAHIPHSCFAKPLFYIITFYSFVKDSFLSCLKIFSADYLLIKSICSNRYIKNSGTVSNISFSNTLSVNLCKSFPHGPKLIPGTFIVFNFSKSI